MTAAIDGDKLKKLHRFANLLETPAKRRFASAYISWLHNGASGDEPSRGRLSLADREEIRDKIAVMKPWQ